MVERPGELDEPRLERMLGRFLARHTGPGITPDVTMFTDLFRIVSEHGLAVPPEIAAVFRALATMEGTLTALAPGFDIVAEARRFAAGQLAQQFSPDVLRKTAADELIALLPVLRRLPAASTGSAERSKADGSASTSGCWPTRPTAATSPACCTRSSWSPWPPHPASWPC